MTTTAESNWTTIWQRQQSSKGLAVALTILVLVFLPFWIESLRAALEMLAHRPVRLFNTWPVANLPRLAAAAVALLAGAAMAVSGTLLLVVRHKGFVREVAVEGTNVVMVYDGRTGFRKAIALQRVVSIDSQPGPMGIEVSLLWKPDLERKGTKRQRLFTLGFKENSADPAVQALRQAALSSGANLSQSGR